jgi:hypothetical protein
VLQIICITMMALALAEDSISKRERRDEIIDELGALPGKMRDFMKVRGIAINRCQTGCAAVAHRIVLSTRDSMNCHQVCGKTTAHETC